MGVVVRWLELVLGSGDETEEVVCCAARGCVCVCVCVGGGGGGGGGGGEKERERVFGGL